MAWINARTFSTTNVTDLIGIEVEWTDETDFSSEPFRYRDDRVQMNLAGREQFRADANAALEAERTKRQQLASRKQQILTFMNGA